jgi:hypothetical protein
MPTMETELRRGTADASRRIRSFAADERREFALLAEFMRHDSVTSLAGEMAERLGPYVRGTDLIAEAGSRQTAQQPQEVQRAERGTRRLRRSWLLTAGQDFGANIFDFSPWFSSRA